MCGIYGYVGQATQIVPTVANALRTMEYRGYDSWGMGWDDGAAFDYRKEAGRVPDVIDADPSSGLAIGHTRWATHGRVTSQNAHPHFDASGQIAVVHNGVIENATELRLGLANTSFLSETDTEIIAHLVAQEIDSGSTVPDAVTSVFQMLAGSNAIVVAHRATGVIVAVTSRSPLRLGRRGDALHLASDPLALANVADEMAIVPDNTLVILGSTGVILRSIDEYSDQVVHWSPVPAEIHTDLGAHPHFTLKEIHDQPYMLRNLMERDEDVAELAIAVQHHRHVLLTGCGSAYYAATLGGEWLRDSLPDCWVDVLPASEIDTHTMNLGRETLVLALTQSGETADVVDAIHVARSWGATVATMVNTTSSTVASSADLRVPLLAGIERSVLATKSFLAMVTRLLQLNTYILGDSAAGSDSLLQVCTEIEHMLCCESLNELARTIAVHDHVLTLGKGVGHKVALEAALKIKEGSYIHAEAFLTGELKHGPLALVTERMPCLLFATTSQELEGAKIASQEIMSRGGFTIGIGAFDTEDCSSTVRIPEMARATSLIHIVVAQLLGYYIAIARGVDPDYPRNLAKSVTVR